MGNPYLNSGESITMTTHRVGLDSVPYDVMLTTHRLTLIDSRYARFEPLMIAFEDILTVKSGTASTSEPVIILTYADAGETTREMNLIFLQQPGEHRKRERDLWVKKLMEAIIAERDAPALPAESPAESDGMQPSIRRWVAPEGITLHTPYTIKDTAPPKITVIPDDESTRFEREAPGEPEEIPEDLYSDKVEDDGWKETVATIPQEETIPVAVHYYDYGEQDDDNTGGTTPTPVPDQDALYKFHTIVIPFVPAETPVNSVSSVKEEVPEEPHGIPVETILAAAQSLAPIVARETHDEGAAARKSTGGDARPKIDEEKRAAVSQPREVPDRSQDAGTEGMHQPKPAPVPKNGGVPLIREEGDMEHEKVQGADLPAEENAVILEGTDAIPERPASQAANQQVTDEHPGQDEVRSQIPGSKEPPKRAGIPTRIPGEPEDPPTGSPQRSIAIIMSIVALLALAGVIILVISFNPMNIVGSPGTAATPVITAQPTATPAVLSIPANGAGIRVIYTGDFAGEVGNPGQMKVVSGNGDSFFPVKNNDGLIQASIQKQDNSGNILTIEVYNNGKMIYTRSANTPQAQLNVLVDVTTGSVAGMTPAPGSPNPQSTPMYF